MEFDGVRLERDGEILNVILDRPPVNAVSTGMYESLIQIFGDTAVDESIQVVVFSSANPKIFSAGADIRELKATVNSETSDLDVRRQRLARETYDLLINLPQPTIAVINGPALGAGAVLIACCDIRVASKTAKVGLTEINVARCGGARHLMRILPQGVVRRMYFTAQILEPEELLRHGAIDGVFDDGDEKSAAMGIAAVIASKSPIALRTAKRALNACEPLPIREGYELEQQFTLELGRSQDAKEATAAFLEKRPPIWTGR
jgi:enoyl-CoA hydratase